MRSAISEIEVDHLDLEGTTFLAVPNHTLRPKVTKTHSLLRNQLRTLSQLYVPFVDLSCLYFWDSVRCFIYSTSSGQ